MGEQGATLTPHPSPLPDGERESAPPSPFRGKAGEGVEGISSEEPTAYRVQLPPIFEGPLDLLLHLVEREQLAITAVSLAQVTEQYLAYLQVLLELEKTQGQALDPAPLADFVAMAARLLWIKSRALLPRQEPLTAQEDEEDPAEALARQLREYKMFKEAAAKLAERGEMLRSYVRTAPPPDLPPRLETLDITLADLVKAMERALAENEKLPAAPVPLEPLRVTIAQKMDLIRQLLAEGRPVYFRELWAHATSRLEIIVSFLAVLELVKRKVIVVRQEELFGEITISPAGAAMS